MKNIFTGRLQMNERIRWLLVVTFAAAMAWVESAVVFYLRVFIDRVQPYQLNPLPVSFGFGQAELVREVATMLMLVCVGCLAGSNWRTRFGYLLLAFGIWDILYYGYLVILTGWPASILDWDILFLIPVPWWGPVLAPGSIAFLMVITGSAITQISTWPRRSAWIISLIGVMLALYTFMADALYALLGGSQAVRDVLPASFNWPFFGFALLCLAVPALEMLWGLRGKLNARIEGLPLAGVSRPPGGMRLPGKSDQV
jgi:hypothetical protein